MARPIARERWVDGYKRGLAKSISNLNTLLELLEERLSDYSEDPLKGHPHTPTLLIYTIIAGAELEYTIFSL